MVQIGWARINMPDMPFNQTFSVPTNLTLHTTDEGIRMFASPIKEMEELRKPNPPTAEGKEITAESPIKLDAKDQLFDILVTVKQGTASKAVLGFGENQVTYDFAAQKQAAGHDLVDGRGRGAHRRVAPGLRDELGVEEETAGRRGSQSINSGCLGSRVSWVRER